MKKFIIVISALCGLSSYGATFALSTNDAINVPTFGGKSNVVSLGKNGDVLVGGTLTVPGSVSIASATVSNETVNGLSIKTAAALSITNLQAITIPNRTIVQLSSPGAFPVSTNSIAAPATAQIGALVYLMNAGTNTIEIAEAGVLTSAGTITLGTKDGVWLYINATNDVIQNTAVINN